MDVSVKLEGFERALTLFDARKVQRAGSLAINDVASRIRTAADRQVRSKFALRADFTKQKIRVSSRSTSSSLQAVITARSRALSLNHFKTRQIMGRKSGVAVRAGGRKFDEYWKSSKQQRGLSAKITTAGGYKPIKRGFSLRHSKGGLSFWRRTGKGRWGTMEGAEVVRVITIASMFKQAHVDKAIERAVSNHWSKRFNYRLDRELAK